MGSPVVLNRCTSATISRSGRTRYAIPAGNLTGPGEAPEIYDWGLRNPWRMSHDLCTGDLWIGDVGEGDAEEIDVQAPGAPPANFGWPRFEGTQCFVDCTPGPYTDPVHEYDITSGGQAIVGGYVYRGSAIPALRGWYVFADFVTGQVWAIRSDGTTVVDGPIELSGDLGSVGSFPISFSQDPFGEIYFISSGGSIERIDPV